MKRIISVIVITVLLASVALSSYGCGLLLSSQYRRGPAMWAVEDEEGNVCYLFGSIHIGKNDKMFPFADIIEDAYDSCDYLALEYDIKEAEDRQANYTEEEIAQYYAQFIYDDGSTVSDHMKKETYDAAVEFLKKNDSYGEGADSYKLVYWYMIIENIISEKDGNDPGYGVDRYFVEKAYSENKPVLSVESEQEQLDMLLSVEDTVYDFMIDELLKSESSFFGSDFSTALLLNLYKNGNMDTMASVIGASRSYTYEDAELNAAMQDYDKKMYTDRNRKMADTVKEYMADGKRVFFVVGCAHMLGDDGIVSLLAKEGYTVYRK